MEKNYLKALVSASNVTETENGDKSFSSSKSAVLDLFALGGAIRNMDIGKKFQLYSKAVNEDALLAARCMFYLRSPRQGQGERKAFREFLQFVAKNYASDYFISMIPYIKDFARWDDLLSLFNTDVSDEILLTISIYIKEQLIQDLKGVRDTTSISLLGKWMPSINTSSKKTRELAEKVRKSTGLTQKEYRKVLSTLRAYLNVVETTITKNKWDEVNYEGVPSKAMMKYSKAFKKHDEDRFSEYLTKVHSGEKKMNMSVTYPHEIVLKLGDTNQTKFLESAWKSLPNFANTEENALVVADVSGSMVGEPLAVSVSLAMYFAERNKGYFKDHFITFSSRPQLQQIVGKTLFEKYHNVRTSHWEMNTNLRAVFQMLVSTAKENHVPKEEFPTKIFIISDMQFDEGVRFPKHSTFEDIKTLYADAGYEIPQIIFWNVRATNDQVPVTKNEQNVILVSGYSPITFKYVLENKTMTPYEAMLDVLNNAPFDKIVVKTV